jgi:hypothetical protein
MIMVLVSVRDPWHFGASTNGSGWLKNMQILRIRIPNTGISSRTPVSKRSSMNSASSALYVASSLSGFIRQNSGLARKLSFFCSVLASLKTWEPTHNSLNNIWRPFEWCFSAQHQCQKGSVEDVWHFGADPDPHLWLMDLDLTLDLTPFLSDFKDAKKIFFPYFFLTTYPQAHYHQYQKWN